jgi:sterol 3beta-glucosyltransferase
MLMKAILFSIGTRGDIEPFLAIAQLLKERNWEVICVFPEQFRKTVEDMGITFRGFSKEFLELLEGREAKMFMGGRGSILKRLGMVMKMSKVAIKLSKDIIALQHKIQTEENPDRIFYHPKCNYSVLWGMANPGKSIMVSPIPGMAHPIAHLTALGGNYGKLVNRLSFWLVNTVKAVVLKKMSKRFREDYNGLKITIASIKNAMLEQENTFYTISPSLFPRPGYWPPQAKVVGYYERNKSVNWQPDQSLLTFLGNYKKIVLITFGSMTNPDPAEKSRIITEVLKRNNTAAIINTSWGGLEIIEGCPDHIYSTENIPYDWLFPQLYAVVHHGGSGTTHTAAKYSCPSLVVPHAVDQFFWAKTIEALQLGPEAIPIKKLNEVDFENRLFDLVSNETYKKRAAEISDRMKTESSVDKLYEMIIN